MLLESTEPILEIGWLGLDFRHSDRSDEGSEILKNYSNPSKEMITKQVRFIKKYFEIRQFQLFLKIYLPKKKMVKIVTY